jgi:hypothetical protein
VDEFDAELLLVVSGFDQTKKQQLKAFAESLLAD